MKQLIKTISGQSCEVYAISHHNRIPVGKAKPDIKIYENSLEVPTIGTNSIRRKRTYFSIVICPDPEMDAEMTDDILRGLSAFDLSLLLPDKNEVYVPFALYGISSADISPDRWVFQITDPVTVRKLLAL